MAKALQGDCAVLIVTGHRDASWLVSDECEFVHIPSLDSLDGLRSQEWDREPFWRNSSVKGRQLRGGIIESVVTNFRPDAIIVDYLPMGKNGELYELIEQNRHARCYLILRGVLDEPQRVQAAFLNPRARHLLETRYKRILVTADRRVIDLVSEYGFAAKIASKIEYTGYVVDLVSAKARILARLRRGIPPSAKWVVCSGGGGMEGEELVELVIGLTSRFPTTYFDLVLGPRSRSGIDPELAAQGRRIRVRKQDAMLPTLHAAADVVICRGGYNSLVESVTGQGRIIVAPFRGQGDQYGHAARLSRFYPISIIDNMNTLEPELKNALTLDPPGTPAQALNFHGLSNSRRIIMEDLTATEQKRESFS